MFPENLKYTRDHEWAKIEDATATIGITQHAEESLGDIVFIELPAVGRELKQAEEFGVVESVKSVSSLYAPISGTVLEINEKVKEKPELINQAPYNAGWLIKIKISDADETANLLSSADYQKLL